jgi:hypothetical protein
MKNKKDRTVVLIVYSAIIVLVFIILSTFLPGYVLLKEYQLQFTIVFIIGIAVGIFLRDLV